MLVLTRKKQEVIQIGDSVFIKVLKIGSNSVKIGVDAPADVRVLRAEVCDRTVALANSCADGFHSDPKTSLHHNLTVPSVN